MKKISIFFFIFIIIKGKSQLQANDSTVSKPIIITKSDSIKTHENRTYINVNGDDKGWWSDWLPFIAALVVAYATYRGVIKQSKATVASFRVNWIEDLRVNYSNFLIALRNVDNKIRMGEIDPNRYSKDEDVEKLNFLKSKIKLMLNHNESEHISFWEALTAYMQDHNEYYRREYSEEEENTLDQKRVDMEILLLAIFKKEWDKAKNLE